MYELLVGKSLTSKNSTKDVKKKFREYIDAIDFSQVSDKITTEEVTFWKDLLLGTLNDKAENRWSARDVYAHF
jgi:hypothetical protein